jgi:hypothetical protein
MRIVIPLGARGVWSHDRVCGRVCLAAKSRIFLPKPGEEGESNGKPLSSSRAGEKGEGVRVGEEAKECIEPSSAPLLPSENARRKLLFSSSRDPDILKLTNKPRKIDRDTHTSGERWDKEPQKVLLFKGVSGEVCRRLP